MLITGNIKRIIFPSASISVENLLDNLVGVAIGICDDMGICYIPYDARRFTGDVNNNDNR